MQPAASVVIPAHDEETVIDRTLAAVLGDAEPGELEVVVVCNGCTDRTAEAAASFAPRVHVRSIPEASKIAALNEGDGAATCFPRVYLDADVRLPTAGVRDLSAALAADDVLAAAPAMEVDTNASSPLVRSYVAMWRRLPTVEDGLAGRGAYALSAGGRARFGAFPDVIADDRFVHQLFAPGERVTVPTAASVVRAPTDSASLLRRRVRVIRGNAEQPSAPARGPDEPQWLAAARKDPRLLAHLPAFLGVSLLARVAATLGNGDRGWLRDDSSR